MWIDLWNSTLHPHLKLLLWKIWSDLLPTKGRLGLEDKSCVFCGLEDESALHLFCSCSVTRALWFQCKWGFRTDSFSWSSIADFGMWWAKLLDDEAQSYIACLCDIVWRKRNNIIFKGDCCNMQAMIKEIRERAAEMHFSMASTEVIEHQEDVVNEPLPHQDFIKYSVDASGLNSKAGLGVVELSGEAVGDWWATTEISEVSGVLEGELRAIRLALVQASLRNVTKLLVQSDSKAAVLALRCGSLPLAWGTYPVYESCLSLCKCFDHVIFSFIPREENRVADALAGWARSSSSCISGLLRDVAPFVATTLM
ncbi:uncharacterized protein LOC133038077 [Cannabis sativa]|uniref:uncharacterized protein LOC133038077 n=1 Tax=Cannabis sativa TaxID=3483 RepID=UPI0029CA53FB|nr:uncharacterized protein LOC133038077 [Cannabis sativa]